MPRKEEIAEAPPAQAQVKQPASDADDPPPRIEEPPPPIAKKDQDRFDVLVREKRSAGLSREDAEVVARRQIAEDNRKK